MVVVAFDRDDEGGEVAIADDLPELLLGFEHAGGGPAQRHLARRPALDVALVGHGAGGRVSARPRVEDGVPTPYASLDLDQLRHDRPVVEPPGTAADDCDVD